MTTPSKVTDANAANMLAMLKSGKVLSRVQEDRLREYEAAQAAAATATPAPTNEKEKEATQKADAEFFNVSARTIRNWRDEGAPGFRPDGTIGDRAALAAWVKKNNEDRKGSARGIEAERDQKIRKLKLANDRSEGRLIERAAVASRMQLAAGELNAFRAKSEAEHAMKFAATNGDPAKCREQLRLIWDEIFVSINGLSKHFADPKPTTPNP